MSDSQHGSMLAALAAISSFYNDPKNEEEYQEWLQAKEKSAPPATNEPRAPAATPEVAITTV